MGKRIFVSNRLPFSIKTNGKIQRGSGGLVSALMSVNLDSPFTWLGFETEEQHAKIIENESAKIQPNLLCQPVVIEKDLYNKYYDGFANDVLWPLFHYEGQLAAFHSENWEAYVQANQLMADAILQNADPGDTVWIHDFHFLYLPQLLRKKCSTLKIGFFLHIPFPAYEVFRQLPTHHSLLKALLHCDLIGFHEHSYMCHFVVSLKTALGLNSTLYKTSYNGRDVHMGVFPISINADDFEHRRASPAVSERCKSLKSQLLDTFLILGVDRLDYTKGLDLKLLGFQRALRKYPNLVGKITLLQVAVPTRQKVPSYMRLKKDVDRLVGSINGEFAHPAYTPVQYIFNSVSESELVALYNRADVALITSKRDGMNLVAMEYAAAQSLETSGVLILSEFAGAATLLTEAITINPWDADAIADSIYRAYTMKRSEKKARMEKLKNILARYSSTKWASHFLSELEALNITPQVEPSILKVNHIPQSFYETLVQAQELKIVLDYDGTLVPITEKPADAKISDAHRDFLQRLSEVAEVCVVSGRPRQFLEEQFPETSLVLVAEHGAFFKYPRESWQSRINSNISSWYPEALKVMESFTDHVPLSFIEQKESSLVWHFRQSPAFAEFQANKLDEELQTGLASCPVIISKGKKIVEAKATECDKGSFVRWLTQKDTAHTTYLCVGDDRTDEDMFAVLIEKGLTIKIGPGPSIADFRFESHQDLYDLLEAVLEARRKALLKQEVSMTMPLF